MSVEKASISATVTSQQKLDFDGRCHCSPRTVVSRGEDTENGSNYQGVKLHCEKLGDTGDTNSINLRRYHAPICLRC